jgi:hypothetical protein
MERRFSLLRSLERFDRLGPQRKQYQTPREASMEMKFARRGPGSLGIFH